MSDYGDDYSDYGEEWFYIEDEYMAADDLAEHAVASPPPTTFVDEDLLPEWDRFDYFNDLEYASDGYDDATFEAQDVKGTKTGHKRKRMVKKAHSRKRRATGEKTSHIDTTKLECSPVVWRSQTEREVEPQLLDDNATPYALLRDWREKLAETPRWARGSPPASPSSRLPRPEKGKAVCALEPVSPPSDIDLVDPEDHGEEFEDEEQYEEEEQGLSQDVLMAALQRQLAAAGGPLSGMDPQQLLEFAMRMAAGKDDGDDIAGEMADAMLEGEGEEDDADAEENLLSWVAQQRNGSRETVTDTPASPEVSKKSKRPPTPPSSETNRSVCASHTSSKVIPSSMKASSLKRKADEDVDDANPSTKVVKKRTTRSFDAPTAASQAKAAPTRATRTTRAKKS